MPRSPGHETDEQRSERLERKARDRASRDVEEAKALDDMVRTSIRIHGA